MDNRGTNNMENKKKMDANTVWQWRMSCVKKYSKCTQPFHYCNKIGLDFNVGSKTHKKLHLQLVTNGVILEIWDFVKMVNENKRHFITNILENNFYLGLESEQHRIDFTSQIVRKMKDLMRKPPNDKHAAFTLFDTSQCSCTSDDELNMASTEQKTDSFLVKMDDSTDSEDEWCSQAPSIENITTEEIDGPHTDDSDHKDESLRPWSIQELNEDVLPSFPYCEEIGLNLEVGSKQSLDPGLMTKGAMLELVHFTRLLTSYSSIVLGVLEHNFDLDVKSQHEKTIVWFKVLDLLKRRKQLIAMFKNESFSFCTDLCERQTTQSNVGAPLYQFKDMTKRSQSKKRSLSVVSEGVTKRCRLELSDQKEINTVFHHTDLCTNEAVEAQECFSHPVDSDEVADSDFDHSCKCPLDSDEISDAESTENQNRLQNSPFDIPRESESICVTAHTPLLTTTDGSFSLPIVNSDVTPLFASQPDNRELSGDKDQTQVSGNVSKDCLMEQEEMEMESNMWKVRANRVKQILFLEDEDYDAFPKSRRIGVEFDVGFGPKQNISLDFLNDSVLLEVANFALAMNASQPEFIIAILEYNFDFGLQSENQKKTFAREIITKVRQLIYSKDPDKFAREVFGLPGLESSGNMAAHNTGSISPELSSISKMKACDVASVCPSNSPGAKTKEHGVDLYPFCKEIGLKLHVNYSQPKKQLKISKLTKGAMTEVANFAEKLCGTFEQVCLDILRHNFDIDFQSGESDPGTNILDRIPIIMEQKTLTTSLSVSLRLKHRLSMKGKRDFQTTTHFNAGNTACIQVPFVDQNIGTPTHSEQEDELDLWMWKLRANQIQQILSVPHLEHCPLYSYSKCKKIGIDFNVGSGAKQNLDPKLLTNGIMVEISAFATALQSAQKEFITEILEYNFHLDLKNELNRIDFAQQILKNIRASTFKKRNGLMPMPFELPVPRCIEESAYPKYKYCPKCYQDRYYELCRDQCDPDHMLHPHPHAKTDTVSIGAKCTKDPSSAPPPIEEALMHRYPHCKRIGLSLCAVEDQPKDKLDTHVLTRGTVKEVARFAKKLCGIKYNIVNDVVKHNFNLGMNSQDINPAAQFGKTVALEHKGPSWFSEIFVIQPWCHRDSGDVSKLKNISAIEKRKQEKGSFKKGEHVSTRSKKRSEEEEINTVSHHTELCIDQTAEGDYYMCPMDSDEASDSENAINQDHLLIPESSDVPAGSHSGSLGKRLPSITTTDYLHSLSTVHSNVKPPFASQPDETESFEDGEQKQIPRNVPKECLVEQEEMETESNMWKLRARRVKQILFLLDKEYCTFRWSKTFGMEFNVGFSPKQNISVESLSNAVLLEVAKFALAMNSSQQEFIMEILEYNFDCGLQSKNHRKAFACEIMNKVRHLKNNKDAVSRGVFELPAYASSVNSANQDMGSVSPELSSISGMKECDVAPVCPSDSPAEDKDGVDLYPFCKEIGLKLHVNYRQPNKKLEISKLTNGAMTEVTNFAEKLCGTFEQICLDVLRHNLDLQSGDPDFARKIFAQIPVILEQKNLSSYVSSGKKIKHKFSITGKLDFQNDAELDVCSTDSSQTPTTDQKAGSLTDSKHENQPDLWIWKLRANQIKQILSVPHLEDCPFYSYGRCKKMGINFDVGSGVKQHIDPKLLTNGIMVELNTFATALQSAQLDFITEILEYNFHLDLKDEPYRTAFTQQLQVKVRNSAAFRKKSMMKLLFELPDSTCIEESTYPKFKYCPRCFQDRNYKLHQDGSDLGYTLYPCLHANNGTVSAEATCTAQKPATSASPEETLQDIYPGCKNIGLSLCVDKDKPKDKLDTCVLTRGIMHEVSRFAKKLCGTKYKIINDVLQHNFSVALQSHEINPAQQFETIITANDGGPLWFDKVFIIQPCPQRDPRDGHKLKVVSAVQTEERKETIKKRQLALLTKKESITLSSVVKPKTNKQINENLYPICKELGLDLDVTSKSAGKEKLDLKLLTRAVVMEIYKFVSKNKIRQYFPSVVYDILEYNFDLSSQHYRRWEFALTIASKVKNVVKSYRTNRNQGDEVFKLPFAFERRSSKTLTQKRQDKKYHKSFQEEPTKTQAERRSVQPTQYLSGVDEMELYCEDEDMESLSDLGTIMQMSGNLVDAGCEELEGKTEIKEEKYNPCYGDMDSELKYMTNYPHCEDVKTESNTNYGKYLVPHDPAQCLGYTFLTTCQNSESNIKAHSEGQYSVLPEPQVSDGYCVLTVLPPPDSSRSDAESVKCLVPVVTAGIQGYSVVTARQDTDSTFIKEEQDIFPVESYQYGVVSNAESEVGIKVE